MFFASSCANCNEPGPQLCRRCRFALASVPSVRLAGGVRAAMPFDGIARHLVVALKYRNRRAVAQVLARQLVVRLRPGPVDVVTWAPTSARRAGQRGFDQAELLARAVARQLGVPCRRMLYRRHTPAADAPQTGRTRWQRLLGPSFRARQVPPGLRVLVVDDVVTTGSTLAAAGASLRAAGVDHVQLVAVTAARAATTVHPNVLLAAS